MEIKICLFDDSPKVIESLSMLVQMVEGINIVQSHSEAGDVVSRVKASGANLVIMDIDMPRKNGITAIRELRAAEMNVPVIVFTVFDDDDRIFDALCAGANGYLLKNIEPLKMIDAMREVVNGGAPMSPGIARKVLQMFSAINGNQQKYEYDLTPREKDILKQLTHGLSYKMIAAECNISFETVRTHMKRIYNKMQVASMTEAVAKAINERLV